MQTAFHLAYHVTNLDEARAFYGALLGCEEGRSTDTWVDFDFFGHQISLHLGEPFPVTNTGKVGEHWVPMRFAGEPGEQATMFFRDPSGNPIEIKGFAQLDKVYAK